MVSTLCLLLFLFIVFRVAFLKKDIFSPPHLFFLSESTTLGIAYLKYDEAMTDFHFLTWLVILGSGFCFWLGCMTVKLVGERNYGKFNTAYFNTEKLKKNLFNYNWKLHLIGSFAALGVISIFYLLLAKQYGGVPLLIGRMQDVMAIGGVSFGILNIFPVSAPLPIFLFLIASFKKLNPHLKLRIIARIMTVATLVFCNLFFLSRGNFAYIIIFAVLLWHYFHKALKARHIFYGAIASLLLFMSVAAARQQYLVSTGHEKINRLLHLPYVYIANNYWNLDYALNPLSDKATISPHYGLGMIEGPLNMTPFGYKLAKGLGWDSIFNETIIKVKSLNTVTFHFPLYNELGFFSLFGVTFLFGFLTSFIYMKMKMQPNLYNIMLYACACYMMAISHHDEFYQISTYYFWPLYMAIVFGVSYPKLKATNKTS